MEELPQGPQTGEQVLAIIQNITNWVFAIIITVSVVYFLLAAFQFVTEGKDPAKVQEARTKLIYAVIGIGIALLANGIPKVLRNVLV